MIQEVLASNLHHLVPRHTAREHLDNLRRVHPRLRPEHESFRDRLDGEGHHDLVARLHYLPRSTLPDVHDRLSHNVEEGLGALEIFLAPADHDRERPGLRSRLPTAYRGVEHANAFLACLLRKLLRNDRRNSTHIHEEHALEGPLQNSAHPSYHHLALGRVRE